MKRGEQAREAIRQKIIEAFKDDYITTIDKKIYVNQVDGSTGEVIQFAISMTMPKNIVTKEKEKEKETETETGVGMTDEDKKKVEELMRKLGILDDN